MRLDLVDNLLEEWGAQQVARLRGAFLVGGHHAHGGTRWAPLAPSTIRRKGHATILVHTGGLAASLFHDVSGMAVVYGAQSKLAVYHQFAKRIPKREPVALTRQDLDGLKAELKYMLENTQ